MSVDTQHTRSSTDAALALQRTVAATVHVPGDATYDAARMPWNVAVNQQPAAVAVPSSPEQVVEVIRQAARLGLRVAPQSTGHGAAPLAQHGLDDVVLLRTSELTSVLVDPERQVVRVGGGAQWEDVVAAAAQHGLAALHGSSPDVGVAGYALGGGISWYARKHGLATNSVVAVEIVTAEGRLVRADAKHRRELFWALRGGGGNFGVVTALELRLFPIADAYAGMMIWDLQHAEPVVRRWATWSAAAPDEVTTSLRAMRFPPMPELPDFLRGRQLVVIDGAVLGDDEFGAAQVDALRALGPEMDTFGRMPAAALSRLHMDPEGPTPAVGGSTMLERLDDQAVTAFLEAFGAGAETPLLSAELRQLGGALGRPAPHAGALSQVDAAYVAFFVAIAATPEMAARGEAGIGAGVAALAPWSNGRSFLNFAESLVDPRTGYSEDAWTRLREVRRTVDPDGMFVANHEVPRGLR